MQKLGGNREYRSGRGPRVQDSFIASEEDMAIVHAVQLAPRVSWTTLARVLHTSPETLERRWRRLVETGLVWTSALPNARFTSGGCLAYIGASCAPADTDRVARTLAAEPEVLSVEVTTGKYDLLLTVATPTLQTMTRCLLDRIDKVPGLTKTHAMLATTVFKNGTQWRLQSLTQAQIKTLSADSPAPTPRERSELTPLDHDLRDALAQDGRMAYSELALRAGTSRNTAQRRIDRMLRDDAFSIRCDIAAPSFGWPISASLGIDVDPARLGEIGRGLASEPHIRLAAAVADRPNLLVSSWLSTLEDVPKFEAKLMERFPDIQIMDRYVNLYSTKRMGRLLDQQGFAIGTIVPTRSFA
jgi:DNA-binding Lrp family transcriptional regulator